MRIAVLLGLQLVNFFRLPSNAPGHFLAMLSLSLFNHHSLRVVAILEWSLFRKQSQLFESFPKIADFEMISLIEGSIWKGSISKCSIRRFLMRNFGNLPNLRLLEIEFSFRRRPRQSRKRILKLVSPRSIGMSEVENPNSWIAKRTFAWMRGS